MDSCEFKMQSMENYFSAPSRRRNHEVKIQISKKEKVLLKKKAEKLGLKISPYIRLISLQANAKIILDY